jgi:zinc transporter ZupT
MLIHLPINAAWALALAAGVTLYVSATDLIPHGNEENAKKMPLLVFVGVFLYAITAFVLEKMNIG